MSDLAPDRVWRRRLAWLVAAVVVLDLDWWLGTLLPLTRPFLFLTTVLIVAILYAAFSAALRRLIHWSLGARLNRPLVRVVVFLLVILAALLGEVAKDRPGGQLATTTLAGLTGLITGECWPELRTALAERGRAVARDLHRGIRGR